MKVKAKDLLFVLFMLMAVFFILIYFILTDKSFVDMKPYEIPEITDEMVEEEFSGMGNYEYTEDY